MSDPEPRRQRALAQLDLIERVLPGLCANLEARVEQAKELAAAAGVSWDDFRAMSVTEREQVLRDGRTALRRHDTSPGG